MKKYMVSASPEQYMFALDGDRRCDSENCEDWWIGEFDSIEEARAARDGFISENPSTVSSSRYGIGRLEFRYVDIYEAYLDEFDDVEYEPIEDECASTMLQEHEEAFERAYRTYRDYHDYMRGDFYTMDAFLEED